MFCKNFVPDEESLKYRINKTLGIPINLIKIVQNDFDIKYDMFQVYIKKEFPRYTAIELRKLDKLRKDFVIRSIAHNRNGFSMSISKKDWFDRIFGKFVE